MGNWLWFFSSGVRVAEADGEKPVLGLLESPQGQTILSMLAFRTPKAMIIGRSTL